MNKSDLGAAIIFAGFLSAFLYPVLQYRTLRRMRGIWRIMACLPLLPLAYVMVVTVVGLSQGSNLWPLLLIFTAPLGLVYLGLLQLAHRWFA